MQVQTQPKQSNRNCKFTERTILFAAPGRHYLGDGLSLIVAPDQQSRRWVFRFTSPLTKRISETGLGTHPVVSLEDAKAKVLALRRMVRDGIDPVQHKKAERQAGVTLKEASVTFIEQHRKHWSPGHVDDVEYMFDVHVKAISSVPVMKLTEQEVRDAFQPLWATSPDQAYRTLAMVKRVLKHAGRHDMHYQLPKLRKNGTHFASLDYVQLPNYVRELRTKQSLSKAAIALEFLILTATRTTEVLHSTWDEINWDTQVWTIPGERTKTGKQHRVPLSPPAIALLKTVSQQATHLPINNGYIFAGRPKGRRRDGTQHQSETTLNPRAMYELVRATPFTVHGFRSTFRNWGLEQTDFDFFLLEMCLAHAVGNATTRAYLRGDGLEKRRAIMQEWAAYCSS